MDDGRAGFPFEAFLECRLAGIAVSDLAEFLEREIGQVRIDLPVLYRQVRVGERGQPFPLLKFRSMREDAERDAPDGLPRTTTA